MVTTYDQIGAGYTANRCTEPALATQLAPELAEARAIVNIGAGTGSYELPGLDLTAVEPSARMIGQRAADAYPVLQAHAHALPFAEAQFTHAMTVLSMHHWTRRDEAFAEIRRVASHRFVAVTWFPGLARFWLTDDYFPEIEAIDAQIFPATEELEDAFGRVELRPWLIPADCSDGFLAAFWRRPEAYLDDGVRASMSTFLKISNLDDGLARLRQDLADGTWHRRNASLLQATTLDTGYRIVTADLRQS